MIISRTPMRISFVGGGSDLAVHYRKYGGAVVSTSINKYVFITVNKRFDSSIRVSYSKTEEVASVEEIDHRLVRESLKKLAVLEGIEITSIADIPSRGSGLGSSSAFTVSLLNALYAYKGIYRSKLDLAAEACEIEIDICKEPIGKQDQYGAALGGLNLLRFNPDESVSYEPVIAPPNFIDNLQNRLLLVYTGVTRSASVVLEQQIAAIQSNRDSEQTVVRLSALTGDFCNAVRAGNLGRIAELLDEGWRLKKAVSQVTTSLIDDMYNRAKQVGAIGGKILGAGSGGFMLLMAEPERHVAIRAALSGFRFVPFRFDWSGSSIIFYHPSDV